MKKKILSIGLINTVLLVASNAATLTSGHVDAIGIGFDGAEFDLHSHAEDGAVVDGVALLNGEEYAPGDLVIQVLTSGVRPEDAAWQPIGVAAGETFYSLPFSNIAGLPFVGVGAEELVATEWTGNLVVTLTNVTGPGIFSLFQPDGVGEPEFFMSSANGISIADKFEIPAEAHRHFGWAFTEVGDYDLTFNVTGTHSSGVKTADATYKFTVVPEPSTGLLGLLGMLVLSRRKR